jgi:DNA-binding NtrC family response regulator
MESHPSGSGPVTPRRVLIVDDDEEAARDLQRLLRDEPGIEVTAITEPALALETLGAESYSVVLTDLRMPGIDGMEIVRQVQQRRLLATVIVMTGYGGIEEAVRAVRLGAYDFLQKPVNIPNLRLVLQRALRERSLQDELQRLREQLRARHQFHNVLSRSPRMHAVFELVGQVASTGTTVLLTGETGTGKEQLARAIHAASSGRAGPLVCVNLAAVPDALAESELFGHEKGAFTGADHRRVGRFEQADGGTLFLDEVGDLPPGLQAKLLRVLQERSFERVGGSAPVGVDVRVIAATNRPLKKLVQRGRFREDLYYRLNVVTIELPPLRERPEDIPLLATHFAEKFAPPGAPALRFSPEVMDRLLAHHWPGNVRELSNVVETACVLAPGPMIEPEHLTPSLAAARPASLPFAIDLDQPLRTLLTKMVARVEKEYLLKALKKTRGHVARAARLCGYSLRSITNKIAEHRIDRTQFRSP